MPGWRGLLLGGWLLLAGLFATLVIVRHLRVARRVRRLPEPRRSDPSVLTAEVATELGVRARVRVAVAGDASLPAPAVVGLLRPTLVLTPEMAEAWPESMLRPVLLHELVHVRRRDALVNALQVALQIAWFFHPLVWVANAALRRERELLCDDEVVRRCDGVVTGYTRAMLAVAEGARPAAGLAFTGLAMAEARSTLGRRIRRMLHPTYTVTRGRRLHLIAAALLIGAACLAISGQRPVTAQEPGPNGSIGLTVVWEKGFRGPERTPVEIQGDYTLGHLTRHGTLSYPPDMLAEGVSGTVTVRVLLDPAGLIEKTELVNGLDPRVDELCVEDARSAVYTPTVHKDGELVAVSLLLHYSFKPTPDPAIEVTTPAPDWEKRFRAVYELAPGELAKLVEPPWIPERMDYYRWRSPMQSQAIPRGANRLILRWRDDGTLPRGAAFFGAPSLKSALPELGVPRWALEGPEDILDATLAGDIVLRDETTIEETVLAFEPIVRRVVDDAIRLRVVEEIRPSVVIRGSFKLVPLEDADYPDSIQVYHRERDTGPHTAGGGEGSLAAFATHLSWVLLRPVVSEADEPESTRVSWRIHRDAMSTEYVEDVLANLAAQTGLRFAIEDRPIKVLKVEVLGREN